MNRDRISATIRALLAKTVENGCTEEEALAAAAKAAEMLSKYNLTVDEIQLRANPFKHVNDAFRDDVAERLWKTAGAISKLTGARYWTSRAGVYPIEFNFFGFDHEVEVSRYLLAICDRAIRSEVEKLKKQFGLLRRERRRQKTIAFIDGMRDRLTTRILDMIPPQPIGTGIVVLRNSLIDAAMADAGFKTDTRSMRQSRYFDKSYFDGRKAGDSVMLNPGVRSKYPYRQLS